MKQVTEYVWPAGGRSGRVERSTLSAADDFSGQRRSPPGSAVTGDFSGTAFTATDLVESGEQQSAPGKPDVRIEQGYPCCGFGFESTVMQIPHPSAPIGAHPLADFA
jgi:hypothetical protein